MGDVFDIVWVGTRWDWSGSSRGVADHERRAQSGTVTSFASDCAHSSENCCAKKTGPQSIPFQNSRSAIVVVVGIVLAGVGFLFIQWYADQVITLNKHAEREGDARRKKQDGFSTKLMAKSKVAPSRVAPSVADDRVRAPATMRIEDLVVGVMAAKLGPIQVKADRSIPGEFLTLKLRITNLSRRPLEYKSWSQRKTGIILCDQHKNYYNRIMIEEPPIVARPSSQDKPSLI